VASPNAALSCDFTGLTNGTEYTFTIVAKNAQGSSSSVNVNATPFHTVVAPNAPSSVTVTPGRGSLNVTWSAPTSGEPPTSYVVSIPGQPDCTVLAGQPLSCDFTGLTPGTSYTATVTAVTSAGSSSGVTGAGTPLSLTTPPAAPTGVTSTSADGSLVVTWTAPTTGYAPTSYTVSIPGQSDCVVNLVANPGAALSCTFSGLTNGTNYTATVTPSNSAGAGTAATASGTPYGTVNSATGVTASVTNGTSATVSWTAPSSIGGGSITGYTVYAYDANGNQVGSCTTTGTTCVVSGLTKGQTYSFKVETQTNHGNSALSSRITLVLPLNQGPVNAYIRGWSYAQREISDGMRKAIGAAARLIVASGNKTVTVTGFANFTALKSLSRDRGVNVAAYLRHELNRFGGRLITIKVVNGGCTTKFGGTVLNRVAVIQGR
jgi:titin